MMQEQLDTFMETKLDLTSNSNLNSCFFMSNIYTFSLSLSLSLSLSHYLILL